MISSDTCFVINYPDAVAEAFDGEFVVVNLRTGTYFSLEATAAVLWPFVVDGTPVSDLKDALRVLFPDAPTDAQEHLNAWIEELVSHQLIRVGEPPKTRKMFAATGKPYQPPALGVHADLQDILLLDPVHDVDEAGWPMAAPQPQEPTTGPSSSG